MSRIKQVIQNLSVFSCSVIMTLVTLLLPFTVTSYGGGGSSGVNWIDLAIIAVVWVFLPVSENWNPMFFGLEGYGFYFSNPFFLFNTFPFWFLSIIFAIQVVRYRKGNADGKRTLQLGILSIIPPAALGFIGLMVVVQAGVLAYVGPIPLQFLVGYILLRYSTHWDIESPFDQANSESWWDKEENLSST